MNNIYSFLMCCTVSAVALVLIWKFIDANDDSCKASTTIISNSIFGSTDVRVVKCSPGAFMVSSFDEERDETTINCVCAPLP